MTSSASLAVVTPMKPMPSGLSSERAAAFRPLTNSRSTRLSSLTTRMRLSGFATACPYNRAHARRASGGTRHPGTDTRRKSLPAQRLGRATLWRDGRLRRRSSHAVLAVRASDHGERRARRGGRPAARADRADGVPLPRQLRQRQRAQGARGPHRGAHQARRAAACGRYGVGYFSVLIACASRLLWRSPALRCRTPFATTRSMTRCDSRSDASAASLLPAATAFVTFLIAVRTLVRRPMLCERRPSAWRARLRADLVLAMEMQRPEKGAEW